MRKETWKFVIQTLVAILTAIATALGGFVHGGHLRRGKRDRGAEADLRPCAPVMVLKRQPPA